MFIELLKDFLGQKAGARLEVADADGKGMIAAGTAKAAPAALDEIVARAMLKASEGITAGLWCAPPYGIAVAYTAGYATLPEAVVEAAAEWVALLFYRTKRDPNLNNAVETNAYGFNQLSPDGKPPGKVRALLAPYRRLAV